MTSIPATPEPLSAEEMTARRAALSERWSGNGLWPMTAFEMTGAVYRDGKADAMSPDCGCCPDCPEDVGRDGQIAAYDRRGLLNLVASLLATLDAARTPAVAETLDVRRVVQAITNIAKRQGLIKDPPVNQSLARIYGWSTTPDNMDALIATEYARLSEAPADPETT